MVPTTRLGSVRCAEVHSAQYTGAAVAEPARPASRQAPSTFLQQLFILILFLLAKKIGLASLLMNTMRSTAGWCGFPPDPQYDTPRNGHPHT
jgi:hypothetical protein